MVASFSLRAHSVSVTMDLTQCFQYSFSNFETHALIKSKYGQKEPLYLGAGIRP